MPVNPKAKYVITAEDQSAAGWRSALSRADANGRKLRATIGSAFAGIVGIQTFTSQIAKAIEFGDEIGKLAVNFGLAAQETSELVAVAKQFDIEANSLAASFRKMLISISQASTGNKELRETFKALGLGIDAIRRLAPDQQFEAIADAISSLKDPTDRARAVTALFGRAGADLLPMFERGAEGIRMARKEAREFGQVLNDIDVRRLQEADAAIKELTASWDAFWRTVAVGAVRVGEGLGIIDPGELSTLQAELGGLADRRNKLLALQNKLQTNWLSQFLLGDDLDQTLAETRQKIAFVEAEMNRVNDLLLKRVGNQGQAARPAAPGFAKDKSEGVPQTRAEFVSFAGDFVRDLRAGDAVWKSAIANGEQWSAMIGRAEAGAADLADTNAFVAEGLRDLGEPVLEIGDSLIQADEVAKEVSRSLFTSFSDVFASIGKGGDQFADSLISSFQRILADQATLALFRGLGDLGASLGGSTGSFLTSIFGAYAGGKASGGPLSQGKWYMAGERGPEPIWGGGPGAYAMGYGRGGGGAAVNVTTHVNVAAGATVTRAEALMIARQTSEATVAKLKDERRRGGTL